MTTADIHAGSETDMTGEIADAVRADLVRVLLVDSAPVVRLGLRSVLGAEAGCYVMGEAGTAAEALTQVQQWRPDVVVLDAHLPDASGADACRALREAAPETQVVVLAQGSDESALLGAIVAGAAGFLLKGTEPQLLAEAVTRAAAGESLLDPASTRDMLAWVQRRASGIPEDDPLAMLTAQEKRILPLIARGMTNREIGAALYLSDQTVKGYVSSLLRKLGMSRRAEAAAFIARTAA